MTRRLRDWLDETHGAGFELVRHFLSRSFDSEMVTTSGGWLKIAISAFAVLFSAAIIGLKVYYQRYNGAALEASPAFLSPRIFHQFVREDMLALITLVMAVTALLTILQWQSLFPSARDYLALAGLPVSARQVFQAKFAALLLLFGTFLLTTAGPPAMLFGNVIATRWRQNSSLAANFAADFSATAGACVFVFFGLLAVQGILLNILPGRLFQRVSLTVQAVLFIATLGALPLMGRQPDTAAWWPPVWFFDLRTAILAGQPGAARPALCAVGIPPLVSVLAYLLSYHRYRRLLLEAPPERAVRFTRPGSWLLEKWIGDPREQAAFAFIWKTLARSRSHRLILLAYAGIALGCIMKGTLDTPPPSLRHEGLYGLLLVLAPLGLSMLVTVGLRYVFSLPVALRANWVFQSLEREGSAAWLAAVGRFVVWGGTVPILVASAPAAISILGWLRACAVLALMFLAALLWFEMMFRRWRKVPFTCTYLPGKKPLVFILARYSIAIPMLAPFGELILYSSASIPGFFAFFTLLAVPWWMLRAERRKLWRECALCYEEQPEAAVMTLDLQPEGELHIERCTSVARPSEPLFTDTLVASKGIVPQAWFEAVKEDCRHPWEWLRTFLEDVRYGLRIIRRNPLVSSVVVLTLTVGIGINASVFTVVNGLAFRPHVYNDPDSFVRVFPKARRQNTVRRASYGEYVAFRGQARSLRLLAAWAHFPAYIGDDASSGSAGMAVSCNFFQVDGLSRPTLGRLLIPEDCDAPARPAPAVISEALWQARFGSDPQVVGRLVQLNNLPVTIVGVVPTRAGGWARAGGVTSIWLPYTASAFFEPSGNPFQEEHLWLSLGGRLAPGFSRSAAQSELNVLAQRQDQLHSGRQTAIETTAGSFAEELKLTASGQQLMLMTFFIGTVLLVLFVACANVATLLLARATARRREIAVRLSLGAPRVRLIRMLLTESMLLAGTAGAISIVLACRVPERLYQTIASRPADFPMPVDWHTFAYVAAVVMLTGIFAGLAPALESVKVDLTGSLKGGVSAQPGLFGMGGPRRAQGVLVAAQVAVSMALVVGAALFMQAERRTIRSDPGYLPQKVVVAPLFFPDDSTEPEAAARLLAITERVKALPGVKSVAFSEWLPVYDGATVEIRPPSRPDASQPVDVYTASPRFLETLGIPLLRGREFELTDRSAIIVSESVAKAFWPKQDPIGKTLPLPEGSATVVGVARDIDPMRFGGSENPVMYRPWRLHRIRNCMSVRFEAGESAGAAAVRAAIRAISPNTLGMARVLQEWIDEVTAQLWNVVGLVVILGLVASVLATTGIYGAVSFAVSQRTKELGIRMALGARRRDIVREVFLSGGKPVAFGLLVGLWLSVLTAVALRQGVGGSPLRLDTANPLVYFAAALLLAVAAAAAMAGPARRGAKADPLEALRCD